MTAVSDKEFKALLSKTYKASQKHHNLMRELNAACKSRYGVPFDELHALNGFPNFSFAEFDKTMKEAAAREDC